MSAQATGGGSPIPPDPGAVEPSYLSQVLTRRDGAGHAPVADVERYLASTDLERRFVAAWRASGLGIGALVVRATNAYALGAAVSMSGLVDEALVSMCERYAAEHPKENP